jgi:hypothetical protein
LPKLTGTPSGSPRPAAAVVAPDQLQRPDIRTAQCHSKIQVRVGVVHLDDLQQRAVAHRNVRAGLENAPADRGCRDIVQQARRAVLR